jgi:hypothetical protein
VLVEIQRARLDLVAVERLRGDAHAALDREREAEAVVVVGVLADQVDPSRREGLDTSSAVAGMY